MNWTKVVNGSPQETWSFQYGPQGIEGATCITPFGTITQNYCTDPSGTPLAMYYTDQRGGIGQTFTGMLYFHYDNFGNTAMLTDASGVPQVLYQYDLRTSLFTSINANNIRNPFTSLGEEGAITDSLTLTTNVDWTVYREGVNISNPIFETLTSSSSLKAEWKDCDPNKETTDSLFVITCDCWDSEKGLSDSEKRALKESLKKYYGITNEQDLENAAKAYEDAIDQCCKTEKSGGQGGTHSAVFIAGESDRKINGEDIIGFTNCLRQDSNGKWKISDLWGIITHG
jgi:hypothetical protein